MRRHTPFRDRGAFSLVEMMLATAVASVVGIAIFSVTNTALMMTARNLSVNLTNNHERRALDRIEQVIQQANTMPVLIDTSGNAASSPAAGASFDYFVGSPYIVTVSGASLPATTTTLTLVRSTNAVASPPIPVRGDVVMMNNAPASVRARIASVVVGSTDGALHQTITVTLAAALGAVVTVPPSGTLSATLVHEVAFIVMPAGSGRELRYYNSYETTANLNDPTQYVVLSDEIALQADDATPFSLSQIQTASFVALSLRVRSDRFDKRLSGKQGDQFNSFARLDVYIRPKINPQ